jgi:hypothetical protein
MDAIQVMCSHQRVWQYNALTSLLNSLIDNDQWIYLIILHYSYQVVPSLEAAVAIAAAQGQVALPWTSSL